MNETVASICGRRYHGKQVARICGRHYHGKLVVLGNDLSYCHFVHHKPRTDWHGMERGSPRWQTDIQTPEAGQGVRSCSGCDDNDKDLHIPDVTQTSDFQSNVTFTNYDGSTVKVSQMSGSL